MGLIHGVLFRLSAGLAMGVVVFFATAEQEAGRIGFNGLAFAAEEEEEEVYEQCQPFHCWNGRNYVERHQCIPSNYKMFCTESYFAGCDIVCTDENEVGSDMACGTAGCYDDSATYQVVKWCVTVAYPSNCETMYAPNCDIDCSD